jgi:hypothetical protein
MTARGVLRIICEVILLALLAIGVFIGGMCTFGKIIDRFVPSCFFSIAGPPLVVAFYVLLCVIMKRWRPIDWRLKILKKAVFVAVFAFSISVLIWWYIVYAFQRVW